MAEPKLTSGRVLHLEYRFDRLLPEKLAQVYQVLVPESAGPLNQFRQRQCGYLGGDR